MRARLFLIGLAYSKWFPTFKIVVSWAYTGEPALEIPHILPPDRMSAGLAIEKPPDMGIGQNTYNYQHNGLHSWYSSGSRYLKTWNDIGNNDVGPYISSYYSRINPLSISCPFSFPFASPSFTEALRSFFLFSVEVVAYRMA